MRLGITSTCLREPMQTCVSIPPSRTTTGIKCHRKLATDYMTVLLTRKNYGIETTHGTLVQRLHQPSVGHRC
jgi:hypothetical protein